MNTQGPMNKIYYKELAHMILEAKKSHGVSSDPRAENQFQLTAGREQFLPFSVFCCCCCCSTQALCGLDEAHPHCGERGILLYSACQFICQPYLEIPAQKWASLIAQLVKNPPAMQEILV